MKKKKCSANNLVYIFIFFNFIFFFIKYCLDVYIYFTPNCMELYGEINEKLWIMAYKHATCINKQSNSPGNSQIRNEFNCLQLLFVVFSSAVLFFTFSVIFWEHTLFYFFLLNSLHFFYFNSVFFLFFFITDIGCMKYIYHILYIWKCFMSSSAMKTQKKRSRI